MATLDEEKRKFWQGDIGRYADEAIERASNAATALARQLRHKERWARAWKRAAKHEYHWHNEWFRSALRQVERADDLWFERDSARRCARALYAVYLGWLDEDERHKCPTEDAAFRARKVLAEEARR